MNLGEEMYREVSSDIFNEVLYTIYETGKKLRITNLGVEFKMGEFLTIKMI